MTTTAHIATTENAHSQLAAAISTSTICGTLIDDVLRGARELNEATFDYTFDLLPYHVGTCTDRLLRAFITYTDGFTYEGEVTLDEAQDWVTVANIVTNAIGCAFRNLGPSTMARVCWYSEVGDLLRSFDAYLDLGEIHCRKAACDGGWDGVDAAEAVQAIRDEFFVLGIDLSLIHSS